ncbi:mechanosensitive ion channel [Kovacikia minuta CCNUW1]|uniref:mechanosensitive ion channel domain-containing protein n=1 Tax=Kovacikia minuta TaxID=2931930 RepID=UPI001CD02281|nr:mechanosensitive ion channel domain-containing protein [Kovacikia minuta]UBF27918.1 mechanosensitive ion channel [Kovacikia minuta CCNUW1]
MSFLELIHRLLSFPLLEAGKEQISLLWILKLLLALIVVATFTSVCKRLLRDYLLVRLRFKQGNREVISTLISYCLGALGFLIVLTVNGLNIMSLAVVLGGLGVGIGFGFQELTRNVVSGLALLLEGKLQVGDYVEFDGLSGYIKEIGVRSTVIQTFDGGDVVVPNSKLVGSEVLNWSYKNYTGKIRLTIGVAYSSEPILVTETLLNSAYMEPAVLYEPPPKVIFKGFGDSSLEFELWVWVSRIDEGISVKSSLNYIIDSNFRQAGIQIPFPQRELWLRNLEERSPMSLIDTAIGTAADMAPIKTPSQPISIRQMLKQVPYFQNISDLHLRHVIEAGYRKLLSNAEILLNEGEAPTAVYVVLSGEIEIVAAGLNERLRTYQAGAFLGEVPILLGMNYIANAQAVGETNVFVIPKAQFEKLLHTCPKLAETFSQEVSKGQEEYIRLRQQLQDLGLLSMTEHHYHFVDWVQTRLEQLFKFSRHEQASGDR